MDRGQQKQLLQVMTQIPLTSVKLFFCNCMLSALISVSCNVFQNGKIWWILLCILVFMKTFWMMSNKQIWSIQFLHFLSFLLITLVTVPSLYIILARIIYIFVPLNPCPLPEVADIYSRRIAYVPVTTKHCSSKELLHICCFLSLLSANQNVVIWHEYSHEPFILSFRYNFVLSLLSIYAPR